MVVLFPECGSGVNVLLFCFFGGFFHPVFQVKHVKMIIRVLLVSFLTCPSKRLGQSSRTLSSLFYLVSVVNCELPHTSAFPSTLSSFWS